MGRGLSPTKIQRIELDGTFRSLENSVGKQFTWTAVSSDNELFANIWAGTGSGIYSVDATNGASTLVTTIPDAYYGSLTFGPDGQLYTVVGQASGASVMRLSGDILVPYADLPTFGFGLTIAPDGDFFVSSPGGANVIYKYEASTQMVSSFASGLNAPSGLGYDGIRDILYVREQGGSIYAFDKVSAVPEISPLLSMLLGLATMVAIRTPRCRDFAEEA